MLLSQLHRDTIKVYTDNNDRPDGFFMKHGVLLYKLIQQGYLHVYIIR